MTPEEWKAEMLERCQSLGMKEEPRCPACKKFPSSLEFSAGIAKTCPPGDMAVNLKDSGERAIYATCCGKNRIHYVSPTRRQSPWDLPGLPA